jgi:ubiquitin-protein ligase
MQNNYVIVRAAVEQNGLALKYAGAPMQDDISVVLPAVQQQGMALQHASLSMKAHPTVVRAAVLSNPMVLLFVPDAAISVHDGTLLGAIKELHGPGPIPFIRLFAQPDFNFREHMRTGFTDMRRLIRHTLERWAEIPFCRSLMPAGDGHNPLSVLEATFIGPHGTPYAGGEFIVRIELGDYPIGAPRLSFQTRILSPYVRNGQLSPHWTMGGPPKPLIQQPALGWIGTVILTILSGSRNTVVAATSSTDTVDALKRLLQDRATIPPHACVLRFQGQSLAFGDRTLGEYGIPEGATINVLFAGPCLTSAHWSPIITLHSVLSVLAIDVFLTFESASIELLWPGTYEGADYTNEDEALLAAEWSRDRHAAMLRVRRCTEKHAARATSRPS